MKDILFDEQRAHDQPKMENVSTQQILRKSENWELLEKMEKRCKTKFQQILEGMFSITGLK